MTKVSAAPIQEIDVIGGFPEESFDKLYELEKSSFWFQSRNQLILWVLNRYFPSMKSFMEIGCGTGYVLSAVSQAFPSAEIFGSDLFEEALRFSATRTPRAHLSTIDATNIPFEGKFQVVGIFDVLEHITKDTVVLGQIRKALVPGGGLLLTVPQHPRMWSQSDEYAQHARRYTRAELSQKLSDSGFELLHCTSFVSLLLPAMMLFRALQKLSGKQFEPTDEMNGASRFHAILCAIMSVERLMIRSGVDFPVGGSLLAVCRAK